MTNKKIILASGSPRRKELLTRIVPEFEVRKSGAEEKTKAADPAEMVKELSYLKAADIFNRLSEEEREKTLVIGADTVVSLDGVIMGKPADKEDAVRMLTLLQGKTHQVYTGVSLIFQTASGQKEKIFFEKTDVTFFPMSIEEILSYAETGEPVDKAGAYGIQGRFAAYVEGISGDYYNVVGLPVGRLYQEMKKI